jgi:hypothetical protein
MNEDIDLELENYDLDDLLNLFKLEHSFGYAELKQAKKMVLKTHPDKSNLDKKYFLFFSNAFKVLYSLYEFRSRSNSQQSTEYVIEQDDKEKEVLIKKISTQPNFNKLFNELFEKHIISDDKGYGDWLKSDEDLDNRIIHRQSDMNEAFERKKTEVSALIKRGEIKEMGEDGHCEITGDEPENYSSSLFSNFQYEDLRRAHVESVIPVTQEDYKNREKFNNEQALREHRGSQDTTPLSLTQSNQYLKHKDELNSKGDMNRAFKLAKQDEDNRKKNENWMSSFKQLTDG